MIIILRNDIRLIFIIFLLFIHIIDYLYSLLLLLLNSNNLIQVYYGTYIV